MRIASLKLKNFKRFTDLSIENVPDSAKLILLIGANGCGKSSIFSALGLLAHEAKDGAKLIRLGRQGGLDTKYLQKHGESTWSVSVATHSGLLFEVSQKGVKIPARENLLYGRSSIRTVPELSLARQPLETIDSDSDRPTRFTRHDTRMEADVAAFAARIDEALRKPVFEGQQADTLAIFNDQIRPLNDAFERVLQSDSSISIRLKNYENSDPQKPVQLLFQKGESTIPFDLLSHGEKQVVTLLLNLHVRKDSFPEAVYFIDEMDLHLHTKLQKALLAEIVTHWIPNEGQLWTASHALGFIEYAEEHPEAVIIDFDELNFDTPQRLSPALDSSFDLFEIAVPKESLAKLLEGRQIVYAEGNDHQFYNTALADTPYFFLPASSSNELWAKTQADPGAIGLRDRDYLMDSDIATIRGKQANFRTIPFYSIESLFYNPENLKELSLSGFDIEDYMASLIERRDSIPLRDVRYARDRIRELRDCSLLKVDLDPIYKAYENPHFKLFYPYLDLKSAPAYLSKLNLKKIDLAKTDWFKSTVQKSLEKK